MANSGLIHSLLVSTRVPPRKSSHHPTRLKPFRPLSSTNHQPMSLTFSWRVISRSVWSPCSNSTFCCAGRKVADGADPALLSSSHWSHPSRIPPTSSFLLSERGCLLLDHASLTLPMSRHWLNLSMCSLAIMPPCEPISPCRRAIKACSSTVQTFFPSSFLSITCLPPQFRSQDTDSPQEPLIPVLCDQS